MSLPVLVGSKKVRIAAQTLTTSFAQLAQSGVSADQTNVDSRVINQLALQLKYTAGAAAVNPNLFVEVQFADDTGVNALTPPTDASEWATEYIEDNYAIGTGVSTIIPRMYKIAGTATVTIPIYIPVRCTAKWARVLVKETLDSGAAGTITGTVFYSFA